MPRANRIRNSGYLVIFNGAVLEPVEDYGELDGGGIVLKEHSRRGADDKLMVISILDGRFNYAVHDSRRSSK